MRITNPPNGRTMRSAIRRGKIKDFQRGTVGKDIENWGLVKEILLIMMITYHW